MVLSLLLLLFFSNYFYRQPSLDENMPHLQVVSNVITQDAKENGYTKSNIASFVDADTRAVRFRYFIAKNEKKPAISYLSLFAKLMRNVLSSSVERYVPLRKEIENENKPSSIRCRSSSDCVRNAFPRTGVRRGLSPS